MSQQKAIDIINKMAADLGLYPSRRRNSFIHYRIPKDWKGTRYAFGYTPWKTKHGDKEGFFAVKYRILKKGNWKLVKTVRFGKRKTARKRSQQWHHNYYYGEAA